MWYVLQTMTGKEEELVYMEKATAKSCTHRAPVSGICFYHIKNTRAIVSSIKAGAGYV